MTADRSHQRARCLPVEEWPERDRSLWAAAQRKSGVLDDPGDASHWAPSTRQAVAQAYGRWLWWLSERALLDPFVPPVERATRERVQAYLVDLQAGNASTTVHMRILQLGLMLEALVPGSRPPWVAQLVAKLRAAKEPARDDRLRLVPVRELLDLGLRLIERAERSSSLRLLVRGLLYRNGLLILCLCANPLRAADLARLIIGRHVERRGDCWWVMLHRGEPKNCRPHEVPFPPEFTEFVDQYIGYWRPVLVAAGGGLDQGHLWLSHSGRPIPPKEFHPILTSITGRELGRLVNPHLFRKVLATEIAIGDPGHVGLVQPLLGHARRETGEAAYNLARSIDASRRVQRPLLEIRRDASTKRR